MLKARCFAVAAFIALALPGCMSLTVEPRALLLQDDGKVRAQSIACAGLDLPPAAEGLATGESPPALDAASIRVVTWNIHKEDDQGWETDLARFVDRSDILLLQEVVLRPDLRTIVERNGRRWVMASSFLYHDVDIGVLSAARVAPVSTCTQRVVEPLLRIPKSAVITWFRLKGSTQTLAVVNVHAINFSLLLGAYRAQIATLGKALEKHRGPIIFAGDLNTWTDARLETVAAVTRTLGLKEIVFKEDRRRLFLGKQLDHIYVRGLELTEAEAIPVTSSDHNPVAATFRFVPGRDVAVD